jgi:hypothetical protein
MSVASQLPPSWVDSGVNVTRPFKSNETIGRAFRKTARALISDEIAISCGGRASRNFLASMPVRPLFTLEHRWATPAPQN